MPYLSDKPVAVSYLDEIDDEDILHVVRKIRKRGNLPDIPVAEERPHVVYSLDGDMVGSYKVEINTDAASTGVDIDSASAVAATRPSHSPRSHKTKKPDKGLPEPRYTFNESLQEDMLEDFHLVRYKYEGESDPKIKGFSKKSPRRRRRAPRIVSSYSSVVSESPPRMQTPLGFNLLCGSGGCLRSANIFTPSKMQKQADEPDEPPKSQLTRSMNSLRNEVSWLYDDMLGSGDDDTLYASDHESKSTTNPKAGSLGLKLNRLWTGLSLAKKKTDDYCSDDDSSDGDETFDDDDCGTHIESLTLASTESSITAEDLPLPRQKDRRSFRA
jgi:hypothetical protein